MKTPEITSVYQLIRFLNYGEGYGPVLKSIGFGAREVAKFCHWDADHQVRVRLSGDDHYDLYLLCWQKDQHSTIHDYDHSRSWIYVLEGELQEENYIYSQFSQRLLMSNGKVLQEGDLAIRKPFNGYHCLTCTADRAVSLHLSSEPAKVWNVYNTQLGKLEEKPVIPDYDLDLKNSPYENSLSRSC